MSYDLGTAHGKIELEYKGHGAVAEAEADMEKVDKKSKKTDKSLKLLMTTLGKLGAVAKSSAIGGLFLEAGIGAASLGIQVLGIIPDLVSISSLAAALPGAFAAGIGSILILKGAFQGVGDTIKAAFDPKKSKQFDEELKKLSPSAQAFIKSLQQIQPLLHTMQQSLQESFFSTANLAGQMPRVKAALGALSPISKQVAGDFGELARRVIDFATAPRSIALVNGALQALSGFLEGSRGTLVRLLTAFTNVGSVGLPLLTKLGDGVIGVGDKFAAFLSSVAASGQLQDWINTGISTLKILGGIVKNVGDILLTVFQTAGNTGGGLLNTIKDLTGQLAAFFHTNEGAGALAEVFSTILSLAKPLSAAFVALIGPLTGALGPAIKQIASVLGPALLDIIQKLSPAFAPLASAIAALVTAVAPLLSPLAQLISLVAQFVSLVAQNLAAELGPVINVLSQGLLGAFQALSPVIGAFSQVLPLAAQAGAQLATALAPLIPAITQIAQQFAAGLIQQLPQLVTASQQFFQALVPLVQVLAQGMVQALARIGPYLPQIIGLFIKFEVIMTSIDTAILKVATSLVKFFQFVNTLPGIISAAITSVKNFFINGFNTIATAVSTVVTAIVNFFIALPGRLLAAIKAIPSLLLSVIKGGLEAAATAVGFYIGFMVGLFTKFPVTVYNAIKSFITQIPTVLRIAWEGAKNATVNGVSAVVSFARALPGKVKAAISSLAGSLRAIATNAWNSFKSSTTSGIGNAVNAVKALPGKIKGALGNVGSMLYSSGVAIIQGLINGVKSGVGKVEGLLSDLGHKVKGAFNDALSIFSPSREFKASGEFIVEGLVLGIQKRIRDAVATAKQLAAATIAPTLQAPDLVQTAISSAKAANPAGSASGSAGHVEGGFFGPYHLAVDQGVLASFTIDAITGEPKAVAAAAAEGNRVKSWVGSGRGTK